MGISSQLPQITVLKKSVEARYGKPLEVHNDFVMLSDDIFRATNVHISETTLERVWNYSTRGYSSVSLHTLNLLSKYCGKDNWELFCNEQKSLSGDSGLFDEEAVKSSDLQPGDRLKIGWLPDRVCVIRYLGENNFIAEECENSTMQPGDSFTCLQFILHQPANLENFTNSGGTHRRYTVGRENGLTMLRKIE